MFFFLRWILGLAMCVAVLRLCTVATAGNSRPLFEDTAARSGIHFQFQNGARGKHDLPEIMGGGLAMFDADGDGLLDLFFCNGGQITIKAQETKGSCRLFMNRGRWRFEETTATAGVPGPRYAMGTAVGDIDGDGREDLFVTGWGEQTMYQNLGMGRFEDVTAKAGLAQAGWGSSAALADLDGDGDLDLYVCHYVDFDPARAPYCAAPDGKRDYCGPEVLAAQAHRLYKNKGNGTFEEVGQQSGLKGFEGRGLGVLVSDMNGDGRLDLFVANDGSACWLLENRGGFAFAEVAVTSGVAMNGRGEALAGMGVAQGDLDGDGRPDLLATNFYERGTVAWRALGGGLYQDDSDAFGIRGLTRASNGFGLALEDFDLDGTLDLLQANGHVVDRERLGVPLAMPLRYLSNKGGRFQDSSSVAGPAIRQKLLGRGLAVGDLDNDGRPDAVVAALDSPALVLKNQAAATGLTLDLVAVGAGSRSPVGAVVKTTYQGKPLVRVVSAGGSYLSTSARELHLPVEQSTGTVERLEVQWPSGRLEVFENLPGGRRTRLTEGSGKDLGKPARP